MVNLVMNQQILKAHRMVNVILDKEAAAGLPEDVKSTSQHVLSNHRDCGENNG